MLYKFKCINGCSDCCYSREYYPSIEYGKIGVLILPEEKERIEQIGKELGIHIHILPRIGLGLNSAADGPSMIILYQMMGKEDDGNLCPFLDITGNRKSPHGGSPCKIYSDRPLACKAYPLIETDDGRIATLDNKCRFCQEYSTNVKKSGINNEINALNKIKEKIPRDSNLNIWRYATCIGEERFRSKFLSRGWYLQNI